MKPWQKCLVRHCWGVSSCVCFVFSSAQQHSTRRDLMKLCGIYNCLSLVTSQGASDRIHTMYRICITSREILKSHFSELPEAQAPSVQPWGTLGHNGQRVHVSHRRLTTCGDLSPWPGSVVVVCCVDQNCGRIHF